jgi:hypothetical protein
MTSAESDLVRCYHDGRAFHAEIGLKRTQQQGGASVKYKGPM